MTVLIPAHERQLDLIRQGSRMLAEARTVTDAKELRDKAQAVEHYLRQRGDCEEAMLDAAELKLRAERRLGELLKATVQVGNTMTPTIPVGISRSDSSRWQRAASIPADRFEQHVAESREAGELTTAGVLRLAKELAQPGKQESPPIDNGCTVQDLQTLVAQGKRFGTIYADPPWNYSNQATRASTDNHYQTMSVDDIAALPVRELAAETCHLHLWTTNAFLFECPRILGAWGFAYQGVFVWCLTGATKVYARTKEYGERPVTLQTLVSKSDPAGVQLWNGTKWTQIIGWGKTPAPKESCKFQLRSGEWIECTGEHVWPTRRGDVRADELLLGDVVLTCRLPEPAHPIRPERLPDDDIGWLAGVFLADGSHTKGGRAFEISSHVRESQRAERLTRIAAAYGGTCRSYAKRGKSLTLVASCPALVAVIRQYVFGDSARTKHLTHSCWQRNNGFLKSLLGGYLEGDGHFDAKAKRWRLGFCNNDALASDLRTLGARLGLVVRLRRCKHHSQWGAYSGWRGTLVASPSAHHNTKDNGEIVRFRKGKSLDFYDVSVADPPNLFSLASGVLTHNCKPQMGIGNCWRVSHEFLLLAIKGDPRKFRDGAHDLKSWAALDRDKHSSKPEQVRLMIEKASPGPYLELFGRKAVSPWWVWGNEVERDLFHRETEAV